MRVTRIYKITDAGPKGNQDNCFVEEFDNGKAIACIADGVTSCADAKLTAEYIVNNIEDWADEYDEQIFRTDPEQLKKNMLQLVMEIHEGVKKKWDDPGSTMDFVVMGGRKVFVVHVGDSRVYVNDEKGLRKVTTDQTVAETERTTGVKIDRIPEKRKPHYLMQCMGVGENMNPALYEVDIPIACDVLLCTDGLTNRINNEDIRKELNKKQEGSLSLLNLVKQARQLGEADNITAILIRRRERSDKKQTTAK